MPSTPTFSYPDASVTSLTPMSEGFYLPFKLSGGVYGSAGTNINRQHDDPDSMSQNQEIAYTQGGRAMVEDYGGTRRRWQFTAHVWISSDAAPDGAAHYYSPHEIDLADVELFITDYAVGAVNPFDWIDLDGTVRRVRLISTNYDYAPYGLDEVWVRFLLEEA